MIYYYFNEEGEEVTFRDFNECKDEAQENNESKIRDTLGGEYFIQ